MQTLRYELKFKGEADWLDVSGLVRTTDSPLNINLCSTDWKSTINTASFSLLFRVRELYTSVVERLLSAQGKKEEVECRISGADSILFQGFVDLKKLSVSSAKLPDSVGITAEDFMSKLKEKSRSNKVFDSEVKMLDGTYPTIGTVIDWLLSEAGFGPVSSWAAGIRDEKLEVPFVATEDDNVTYLDRIATILQEYGGYVLVSEPSTRTFSVRKMEAREGNVPTVGYLVADKLKSESSLMEKDGVVIKYGNVKRSTAKQLVYMHNISLKDDVVLDPSAKYDDNGVRIPNTALDGSETIPVGDVVAVNGYFPLDSDIQKTYEEYDKGILDYSYNRNQRRTQNADMGLYYVDPNTIEVNFVATDRDGKDTSRWFENKAFYSEEGKFYYPAGGEFHPRKAWQSFHNKSGKLINVKDFTVHGKAVYSDKESRLVMPSLCKDPHEYSASYVCSEARASALAVYLTNLKRHGGDTSTWTGRWSEYGLGDTVYVEHKAVGKIRSIIVKKALRVIGNEHWAEYVAVHTDGWETARDYTASTSNPSGGSDYQDQKRIESMRPIIEYALIPADSDFASGVDFGFDEGHVYGFSADTSYGADWDWNDGQIDPAFVVSGMNVWQRTSVDGGKTWRYSRLTGESAKVFTLKADSLTYEIDLRAIDGNNDPITVVVEKSGYRGEATVECVTAPNYFNASTGALVIPKNTPHSKIVMKATLEGADNQYLTISGIDKTQYGSYLGKDIAGIITLDGDFYVDTADNLIKYKKNGEWKTLSEAGLSDGRISEIVGIAQKDALSLVQSGTITMSEYAYLTNVIANTVAASYIKVGGAIYGGGFDSEGNNSGTRGFYLGENGYYMIGGFATDGFSSGLSQDIPSVTSQVRQILYFGIQQNLSCVPSSAFVGRPGLYVYTSGTFTGGDETITASETRPIYLYIRDATIPNGWGSLAYTLSFEDANEPLGYRFIYLYGNDDGKWVTNQGTTMFSANLSGGTARTSIERLSPPVSVSSGMGNVNLTDGRRMYYFGGNVGEQKAAYKEGYIANMNVRTLNVSHRVGSGTLPIYVHSGTSLTSTPVTEIPSNSFVSHVYGDGTVYVYADYGTFRFEAQRLHGVYEFWLMYRPDAEDVSAIENIDAVRIPVIGGLNDDLLPDALDTAVFEVSVFNCEGRGNTGFYAGGSYVSVANCIYDTLRGLTMHFFTGYGSSGSRNSINRPVTIHGRMRGLWNK